MSHGSRPSSSRYSAHYAALELCFYTYRALSICLHTNTQVLTYALPAAVAAVGINSQLPGLLPGISSIQPSATAVQGEAAAISSIQQLALLHLSQEAVLALLLPAACRLALGPRVTAAQGSAYWATQTLGTCLLLFPLVDPGLSSLWQPAAEVGCSPPGLHNSTSFDWQR